MRIAQVVPTYPPYRGGMGHVAHEYTGRLRERGHSVEVFTPSMADGETDTPGVHRLRTVMRMGNAAFVPSLYQRLAAFDLVHLHLPFFGGAEPVLLRRWIQSSPPLLVTYHMDAAASGLRDAIFRAHERLVLPQLLKTAARVLVSSMDYAEHSALSDIDGVLARVEVHPFGVDLERFHPGTAQGLRTSFKIASEDIVLLFVARLDAAHHFKGLALLIEALRQTRHDRWRLMVVGDGPMRPAFETQVASANLTPQVSFAGDVEPADLPAYYRLADVHVFPSTGRSEAFGLVCLEAAASGIPSVASDLPGVRRIVVDGQTGVLVPPGSMPGLRDRIGELLANPDSRLSLGRTARARAEAEFAWDPLITRLEQTCRNIIGRPG